MPANVLKKVHIRKANSPFPFENRFIGNPQLLRQLRLRQVLRFSFYCAPSQVELHFSGLRSKKSLVVPTYFVDCHKTAISYCVTVLPQKTIFVISAFSLYHTNPTAAPSLIIFAASFSVTFLQFDLTSIPDSSTSYTQE